MESNFEISCPCCGTNLNVNDLLKEQLLNDLEINLKNEKSEYIKNHISKIQKQNKKELEQAKSEAQDALNEANSEIERKSQKIKELSGAQAELIRLKQEYKEKDETAELEVQKKIQEALEKEESRLFELANDKSEFKIKALEKKLEDQISLTNEMKRKQEQGSVQLQGEAGELVLEEWLKEKFRLDDIIEIKKGENGADCLQKINTRNQTNCGSIYYESKRTKSFQNSWIEKLKKDIREKGADVGVLVTKAMPPGLKTIGKVNGILVCGFKEFKVVALLLRDSLIRINNMTSAEENKAEKMNMLYSFLTSNEFRLQVESVVEGLTEMQTSLIKEKTAIKKLWKQREKHIEKVVDGSFNLVGAIKGIAGKSLPTINLLELDS